jgi:hypothetical protein
MKFASRLLGLAAKIGLDLLIGTKRTDEAIALFGEWLGSRGAPEQAAEVTAAHKEAEDTESVRAAVEQAAAEANKELDQQQLDHLVLSVSAGLDVLAASAHPDPAAFVERLGSRRGTYALWLDLEAICGKEPGHYCHFNWDDESFRIRDYIGRRILSSAATARPPGIGGGAYRGLVDYDGSGCLAGEPWSRALCVPVRPVFRGQGAG